jgi:hypothetical protein
LAYGDAIDISQKSVEESEKIRHIMILLTGFVGNRIPKDVFGCWKKKRTGLFIRLIKGQHQAILEYRNGVLTTE